jgi:hypothetical protein
VYGAIDGTDSNGNGILDSEENTDPTSDFDGDGTPDFQDVDTARLRHAKGITHLLLHTSNGSFANVEAVSDDDPTIPQSGKPSMQFPYGATSFQITGLSSGESATVTLVFPENVPTSAKYYKINTSGGWTEIPFDSNDGDTTITIILNDGDNATDADGAENGVILDPGALGLSTEVESISSDDDGICFISAIEKRSENSHALLISILAGLMGLAMYALFGQKGKK